MTITKPFLKFSSLTYFSCFGHYKQNKNKLAIEQNHVSDSTFLFTNIS